MPLEIFIFCNIFTQCNARELLNTNMKFIACRSFQKSDNKCPRTCEIHLNLNNIFNPKCNARNDILKSCSVTL